MVRNCIKSRSAIVEKRVSQCITSTQHAGMFGLTTFRHVFYIKLLVN